MTSTPRFWRNVALIGIAHSVIVVGLVRWSGGSQKPAAQKVVWLSGAAGDAAVASAPAKSALPPATPAETPPEQAEEDQPTLVSAKSEIQLPLPTATPTPTAKPKPSIAPKIKATPPPRKPKPRPTATPKPRPSPRKLVVAKASPRPTTATREEPEKELKSATPDQTPTPVESAALGRGDEKVVDGTAGARPRGGGGSESQFGWYGSMLHDRFYSEWAQPTNVDLASAKNSVLVKLRIEKDGRVSSCEIVRPSGNTAVDESVRAAAKRVAQVDPLPPGLGNGDHYDVKIKFELSSD